MKKIFVDENPGNVQTAKLLLERQGIDCFIRNEFASGGVGELAFLDTWPELWIHRDEDVDEAARLLETFVAKDEEGSEDEWLCPQCAERNNMSFEICWKCGWAEQ